MSFSSPEYTVYICIVPIKGTKSGVTDVHSRQSKTAVDTVFAVITDCRNGAGPTNIKIFIANTCPIIMTYFPGILVLR